MIEPLHVVAPAHPCARDISASLHVVACIEDPVVIEKILPHLEHKDPAGAAGRLAPFRAPPLARLFA